MSAQQRDAGARQGAGGETPIGRLRAPVRAEHGTGAAGGTVTILPLGDPLLVPPGTPLPAPAPLPPRPPGGWMPDRRDETPRIGVWRPPVDRHRSGTNGTNGANGANRANGHGPGRAPAGDPAAQLAVRRTVGPPSSAVFPVDVVTIDTSEPLVDVTTELPRLPPPLPDEQDSSGPATIRREEAPWGAPSGAPVIGGGRRTTPRPTPLTVTRATESAATVRIGHRSRRARRRRAWVVALVVGAIVIAVAALVVVLLSGGDDGDTLRSDDGNPAITTVPIPGAATTQPVEILGGTAPVVVPTPTTAAPADEATDDAAVGSDPPTTDAQTATTTATTTETGATSTALATTTAPADGTPPSQTAPVTTAPATGGAASMPPVGSARIAGETAPILRACASFPYQPQSTDYQLFSFFVRTSADRWAIDRWYDEGSDGVSIHRIGTDVVHTGAAVDDGDTFSGSAAGIDVVVNAPSSAFDECGYVVRTSATSLETAPYTQAILDTCVVTDGGTNRVLGVLTEGGLIDVTDRGDGTAQIRYDDDGIPDPLLADDAARSIDGTVATWSGSVSGGGATRLIEVVAETAGLRTCATDELT